MTRHQRILLLAAIACTLCFGPPTGASAGGRHGVRPEPECVEDLNAAERAAADSGLAPGAVVQDAAADPKDASLLLGDFTLAQRAVLDGDTIRVVGLDKTLRLLAIDTEEIYHHPGREEMAQQGFAAYYKKMRGDGKPVKTGTPMGIAATEWTRHFLAGVHTVRLEYDDHLRHNGYYGRYLVYIFVKKNGHWYDYNLEAVRAGMAPYFVKYGRSRRFDALFVAAQDQARAAHRGIWSPKTRHYPDYAARLTWWNRRADALDHFRSAHAGDTHYVELGVPAAFDVLRSMKGKVVTVFGPAEEVKRDEPPFLFLIGNYNRKDFDLVAWSKKELATLQPKKWHGEYVYVRGRIRLYHGKPEMMAKDVQKIWTE